jgi:RNA polymerase sigma factor (sigma-70 family)
MTDVNDMDLVRRYTDGNSEPAFAELVHRHINLVYSVALRCVSNAQDAQDVTQAVFVILAQKAAGLREPTTLTGWLYETTRFTAMRFLRTKTRRQFREQEAYMRSNLNESNAISAWQQLAPLLENAMTRLNEKERTVLALRFFENKSGTETATLLGIQEWAAHKRMGRALEKLRKFFSQRGMTFSAATIAGAISAHSVQAAPAGLAKTISVVAMTKGAASAGSTLALVKGALKIMAWSKIKTAVVAGAIVIAAAGIATVSIHVAKRQKTPQTAFAGYASPEAAIQSTIWAAGTGDFERLSDSVTPQMMDDFKNRMKGRSAEVIKQQLVSWANAMRDYKITQKEVVSDDEVRLHIQATPSPAALHDGKTVIVMKKIGEAWKQAGEVVN